MEETMFKKSVSKGSRFNQIYVPRSMDGIIGIGDLVEVRLLKKHQELFFSNKKIKLSDFKKRLIKDVFLELKRYKNIKSVFFVGSFLTKIVGYNDVDMVLVTDKKESKGFEMSEIATRNLPASARSKRAISEHAQEHASRSSAAVLDKKIKDELANKFNQNFHIILYTGKELRDLLAVCPLTIAMFTDFVTNKKTSFREKTKLDKKHLLFLLMMPEDLLKIEMPSRVYFENLRRLTTIERFLENKSLDKQSIETDLRIQIKKELYNRLESDEAINDKELKSLREIINNKINKIKRRLEDGKKR